MITEKIDFVITWLDDSDPEWQKEFEFCSAKEKRPINTDSCRYRDWGTLKYWFRGVEKYAPWVNKIFFVTYGHLPKWLDTTNPKLVIVRHEDFIPAEFLPTFSSTCIMFFLHKIKGLSENFVRFDDDTFIISSVSSKRFFRNGLPCDIGWLQHFTSRGTVMHDFSVHLALDLIREHFNKKETISRNRSKWYSITRLTTSKNNLLYYCLPDFPGFANHHLPQGYLKKTYEEVWLHCKDILHWTCSNKFRTYGNVSPWLIRYWQLASGNFTPCSVEDGRSYNITEETINEIKDCIERQKLKIVCLNDNENTYKFEEKRQIIQDAFNKILPDKCSFEL